MKKVFFAAGITLLGLSAVYAQNMQKKAAVQSETSVNAQHARKSLQARSPEQIAEQKTVRLDKEVGMNADQKKKVYEILLKEAREHKGRAALRQETNTEIKGILTPEQNQKLEARQSERKQMMMERKQTIREGKLESSPSKKIAVPQ